MSRPGPRRQTADPPRTVGLISNPTAGGGQAARLETQAVTLLEDLGLSVDSRSTARSGHARALARELAATVDVVAVLGGDGTVNEVVNGLAGSSAPLAILPGGTVNVLALELGLPFDLPRACALLTSGARTTLDLGRIGDRWFTLHAGVGLDALTVRTIDPEAKRRFRKLAFVAAGVRAFLAHPQPRFRVVVDGVAHTATFAVAANCEFYAGRFGVAVDADPQDGLFDVVLYQGSGFARTAAFWLVMPVGAHVHHPQTKVVRGREVRFELLDQTDVVWIQTDGELVGRLPATATLVPGALEVFVPQGGARSAGRRR